MDNKKAHPIALDRNPAGAADEICFGLDRATDERSLAALLAAFADPELQATLAPRLTDAEINDLVDHLFRLLRHHLSHREYHCFF
ncbi:MAG: hypothetical protein L3J03_07110 [Desulfobacterales bacterium]|nr:hypothetical protein [Desulfobacterales bacterium]